MAFRSASWSAARQGCSYEWLSTPHSRVAGMVGGGVWSCDNNISQKHVITYQRKAAFSSVQSQWKQSQYVLPSYNFLFLVRAAVLCFWPLLCFFLCFFFLLPECHVLVIFLHFAQPPSYSLTSAHPGPPRSVAASFLRAGYSPAWEVCSLLGQCEGYAELEARQELLAFSLTHCPPDSIHGLLAASSHLQTQVTLLFCLCLLKKKQKNKPNQTSSSLDECDV